MAKALLHYCDDEKYPVELFDAVDVTIDGSTFAGQVRHIYPKLRQVTVRYEDHHDLVWKTLEPRKLTARVPVDAVMLVARDM